MIRAARLTDVPRLAELELMLFGADAWGVDSLRGEIEGAGRVFLVRTLRLEIIGYVVVLAAGDPAAGDPVDLTRIGVDADHRRTGTASELLAAATGLVPGAQRMLLEVGAANEAALAFYRRHGFVPIHTRPGYYRDGDDAVVMERLLEPGSPLEEDGQHG